MCLCCLNKCLWRSLVDNIELTSNFFVLFLNVSNLSDFGTEGGLKSRSVAVSVQNQKRKRSKQ